ncbi:MAG: hypothetical protein Q8N83_11960 [Ignavibacteria bacterium]|nr:hypothetical protein [Ignavibacteria bacterium]
MIETKEYIPGNNILGALAANYIKMNKLNNYYQQEKPTDSNFLNWFVNGTTGYSNAYKIENGGTAIPLPLSIQHIKNEEGKIYDLLYDDTSEQMKAFRGFGMIKGNKLIKTKVVKSSTPHHERDYETGAAKSGIFFNYGSISAGQEFEGVISLDDNSADEFYEIFSKIKRLRIGKSKTAEYGNVEFALFKEPSLQVKDIIIKDGKISLTLLSNMILYDENGFPTIKLENLEKYLKKNIGENVEIIKAFLKSEENENYVGVWKLRKPSEISFMAGSCLLLKVDDKDINEIKKLQTKGMGERRHEGYGKIDFGLQSDISITLDVNNEKRLHLKPVNTRVPEIVCKTAIGIANEYLKKAAAVEALTEVSKAKREEINLLSHQVSRLEGIARLSETDEIFKKNIKTLRKTSKDKLNDCVFAGSNLFMFLTGQDILNYQSIKTETQKIEILFADLNIDKTEIDNINKKLFKVYYLTLFAALRKAIKEENKK